MTAVDVRRVPRRQPGRPLPEPAEPEPRRIPLAAPPWIDTADEQAARRARLDREVAEYNATARCWNRAISDGLRELAATAAPQPRDGAR